MPVGAPAAGANVHFHITSSWEVLAELHDRASEIRPAFEISKTGMKHANVSAVQGDKLIAEQALVLPYGLQQVFGWRIAILLQLRNDAAAGSPVGIGIGERRGHVGIAFAPSWAQSQALRTAVLVGWKDAELAKLALAPKR